MTVHSFASITCRGVQPGDLCIRSCSMKLTSDLASSALWLLLEARSVNVVLLPLCFCFVHTTALLFSKHVLLPFLLLRLCYDKFILFAVVAPEYLQEDIYSFIYT